jgi:hypothetical protein
MSKFQNLPQMVLERKALREKLTADILRSTALEMDRTGGKGFSDKAASDLEAKWRDLDALDPGAADADDDIQQAALRQRVKGIQARQEGLAKLLIEDGDILGQRLAALVEYEHELNGLAATLRAIAAE